MFHTIRFYSGEGKPTIFCRSESGVERLELSDVENISFSKKVSCIGYKSPEGYRQCPHFATNTRQCPSCLAKDMSRAYTVGDFSGYPALYDEARKEEYALYLAGFGEDIIKCGITRKERFLERMTEQGADFGCIICVFFGPDGVYSAEANVQSRFQFANSVRLAQKMRRLNFDRATAIEAFRSSVQMVCSSGMLPDFSPDIVDFSPNYPKLGKVREEDNISGKIIGSKGEILFYRSSLGVDCAVNMRKKVGTHFEREKKS